MKLEIILLDENADKVLLENTQLICELIPEIRGMIGFQQNNPHHYLDVWTHTAVAVTNAPKDYILRITMLLHDIAKPKCYTEDERGGHFYGHSKISSAMAIEILTRLGHDSDTVETVSQLIMYHDTEIQPRKKHLVRWLNKIGEERLRQLVEIKKADAKAQSEIYRQAKLSNLDAVLHLLAVLIEERKRFSLKDLVVNGKDLIAIGVPQGNKIGGILKHLLNLVIDGHVENEKEELLSVAENLTMVEIC